MIPGHGAVPKTRALAVAAVCCFAGTGCLYAGEGADIYDIRPPVDMPHPFLLWLFIVSALALAGFGAWMLRVFWGRKKRPADGPTPSAWDIASRRLAELQEKKYPSRGMVKEYYVELSDILRKYIEARFSLNAPDMTTEEFLDSLKHSSVLAGRDKDRLAIFLTGCDLVKFAKYSATEQEMDESLMTVRDFIVSTQPVQGT